MAKPFVFVLMPFDSSFDDIYKLGIKAASEEVGAYCERVDEQHYDGRILDRIYNQISTSDYVIADMSGRNPNVFYETGYAHALNKKVILLVGASDDIPFDLKHHPHIVYNNKITTLKEELKKKLNFFISNPSIQAEPSLDGLEFSINGVKLVPDVEINLKESGAFSPQLLIQIDIHNTLDTLFSSGFEISLESSIYLRYNKWKTNTFVPIIISEKRVLHRGGRVEKILPNSYVNKSFLLVPESKGGVYSLEYKKSAFILRIGNEVQSIKIPFNVNIKSSGFGKL